MYSGFVPFIYMYIGSTFLPMALIPSLLCVYEVSCVVSLFTWDTGVGFLSLFSLCYTITSVLYTHMCVSFTVCIRCPVFMYVCKFTHLGYWVRFLSLIHSATLSAHMYFHVSIDIVVLLQSSCAGGHSSDREWYEVS